MTENLKGVGAVVNKTGCCTKCRGQYPLMKKMFVGHKDTCCYPGACDLCCRTAEI